MACKHSPGLPQPDPCDVPDGWTVSSSPFRWARGRGTERDPPPPKGQLCQEAVPWSGAHLPDHNQGQFSGLTFRH